MEKNHNLKEVEKNKTSVIPRSMLKDDLLTYYINCSELNIW